MMSAVHLWVAQFGKKMRGSSNKGEDITSTWDSASTPMDDILDARGEKGVSHGQIRVDRLPISNSAPLQEKNETELQPSANEAKIAEHDHEEEPLFSPNRSPRWQEIADFYAEVGRRLREEIERKVTIVQQSPARSTVAQVRQTIKEFGDKCYEFEELLTQEKLDYIELKGNPWEMTYTVKESINYMLKLKDMRAKHLDEMRELSHWMDQFYLAHEWYEILVAVGHRKLIA
ncbi:unnamed protein product [Cylicostephanus goldi]|uniref:Uncharacterized protein n=1 Tax=Cylicostephanus goldi TaxID=71465 RepID=A0A3P7MIE0_CYLGO|nr:unnamed protein product [Cylicostephanus goldi]